ncbi:hypothetical protein AK812_SmicGene3801 [Symbiodinium microadriaticum]|uniref:Uncharacterized protein n=1 Tax=Symbiodinium microadriaticum TaxID=2951 RepID=A0A1Q9EXV9_SYMMI|nr:hypothetical protein AK812_SmicGene3801 [Symbiodinium microadriaticum]
MPKALEPLRKSLFTLRISRLYKSSLGPGLLRSNNIKNLRKEKKDLEASVEDAAEMLQADQGLSEKYQEEFCGG